MGLPHVLYIQILAGFKSSNCCIHILFQFLQTLFLHAMSCFRCNRASDSSSGPCSFHGVILPWGWFSLGVMCSFSLHELNVVIFWIILVELSYSTPKVPFPPTCMILKELSNIKSMLEKCIFVCISQSILCPRGIFLFICVWRCKEAFEAPFFHD